MENYLNNKSICLIGMPGAGKSTIGVVLAKAAGLDFIDSDLVIQHIQGEKLQDMIDEKGMDCFLEIEKEAVLTIDAPNSVIATGGSVVYKEEAMVHLKSFCHIVFLELPFDVIDQRINNITTRGIAMGPNKTLKDIYDERMPLYYKYADYIINCGDNTVEKVVEETIDIVKNS